MQNIGVLKDTIDYVVIPLHKRVPNDVLLWLDDYDGRGHFALGGYGIYFEREEDATVFALKWA